MEDSVAKRQRLGAASTGRWSLKDFRVVVTGSSDGIGLAIAKEMLSLGAKVLLVGRDEEKVKRVAHDLETLGGSPFSVACDVSTKEGRTKLVNKVSELWHGELDGLVNNVGKNVRKRIQDVTDDEYSTIVAANVDSTWFLCRDLKTFLEKSPFCVHGGASVVNVGSVAGVSSTGTGSVYAMAKAAVNHLAKSLGCEWAPLGIRVNAVCPWMTMTPLLIDAISNNPAQLEDAKAATPMGRIGNVEDTAGLVTFLCMPAAAFVTGQIICADGGLCSEGFRGPCVPAVAK